jgi:hypothetical protein
VAGAEVVDRNHQPEIICAWNVVRLPPRPNMATVSVNSSFSRFCGQAGLLQQTSNGLHNVRLLELRPGAVMLVCHAGGLPPARCLASLLEHPPPDRADQPRPSAMPGWSQVLAANARVPRPRSLARLQGQ